MTRILAAIGWSLVVLDIGLAVWLVASRGGDAATRGVGPGLGSAMAALAAVAAVLLWFGRAPERGLLAVLGAVLAGAPLALGVALTVSGQGVLGLIFPSMRYAVPRQPLPKYEFPDAAGRAAALAIVRNDYEKLDSILRANPTLDLTARDELGGSLLGLATTTAIIQGGTMRDLEGMRLLLAAGAKPRSDDMGPYESVIASVAYDGNERNSIALELLLDAGLSPDTPMRDGQQVLFYPYLAPKAATLLLARGANRMARGTNGDQLDWSAVTYQADLGRWATALALLEGGVPVDFGTPVGSVLARVLRTTESQSTAEERADSAFRAFMAATGTTTR